MTRSLPAVGVVLVAAGVAVAGPPVKPPPQHEYKDGRWHAHYRYTETNWAYFLAAAVVWIPTGLGLRYAGRRWARRGGRAWVAGLVGLAVGGVVGVAFVGLFGRPDDTPEWAGPVFVGAVAVAAAGATLSTAREPAAEAREAACPPP